MGPRERMLGTQASAVADAPTTAARPARPTWQLAALHEWTTHQAAEQAQMERERADAVQNALADAHHQFSKGFRALGIPWLTDEQPITLLDDADPRCAAMYVVQIDGCTFAPFFPPQASDTRVALLLECACCPYRARYALRDRKALGYALAHPQDALGGHECAGIDDEPRAPHPRFFT
jgi:hypothetical protein